MKWISVKERLPKKNVKVLVYGENNFNEEKCFIGFMLGELWLSFGKGEVTPTHWQPLPGPPEGE